MTDEDDETGFCRVGKCAMRLIDFSFTEPAENLALDEVLLDRLETGVSGPTLRFWESPVRFVVIGTAQVLTQEVNEAHCRADGIPIMRRCSAGGAVLQGPGSLNFALTFTYELYPQIKTLHASYACILNRIAESIERRGFAARHEGICDLALEGGKVSGNAQRRRRRAMLHHGTLLYEPDHAGMDRYLREPEERPEYRGARNHREFVGTLPLSPAVLRKAVCEAFDVLGPAAQPTPEELASARALARQKYLSEAWIRRR